VYETTPTGRQPIKGAIVFLDVGSDLFVASTETDDAGRFYFCRVDADLQLGVSAVGLQPNAQFASLSGGTDRHLEFEFRR
jgi:hypothetical protein